MDDPYQVFAAKTPLVSSRYVSTDKSGETWAYSVPCGRNSVKVYENLGATALILVTPVDTSLYECKYSRVPNKRTGRLLENEKNSHLYTFIQTYTFINFQQKVPPIRLFPPILLLILYFQSPIL